jgi:starch phosphorylase
VARPSTPLLYDTWINQLTPPPSAQCNPELSALISKTLKLDKSVWLKDLTKLEGLLEHVENKAFRQQWAGIKQRNKERLAHHVQTTLGLKVNTHAMFDVQIKVR